MNDYEQVDHRNMDEKVISRFFSPRVYSTLEFKNQQLFDFSGLQGRLLSSSYCPLPGEENFAPLLTALEILFNTNQINGEITFDYRTLVYVGRLHPGNTASTLQEFTPPPPLQRG